MMDPVLSKWWETFLININFEMITFNLDFTRLKFIDGYASSHPNNKTQMSEEVTRSISGFNSAFSKILLKCVRNTNHKHILKLYI